MLISVICASIKICRYNEAVSYGYVRTRGEKKGKVYEKTITLFSLNRKRSSHKKSEISNLVTEMSPTSPFCTLPLIKLLLI